MKNSTQPESAVDRAQRLVIEGIVNNTYPIHSELPGERTLSKDIGVARNALREALQRLNQNGWIETSQGKATRIRDFLRDGNLSVLIDLLELEPPPLELVPDVMRMWSLMAHDYTALAVQHEANRITERLTLYNALADSPEASIQAMWQLHRDLIDYSGNIVYGLVLNSFAGFYRRLALRAFADESERARARQLWTDLHAAVSRGDHNLAADTMRRYIVTDGETWLTLPLEAQEKEVNDDDEARQQP